MIVLMSSEMIEQIDTVQAELDELAAAGVQVAIGAADLVVLESGGLVINLVTGDAVTPLLPLERRGQEARL
jgi:hypothetical protein